MKPPPPTIDLATLAPTTLLLIDEVASIYRLSPKTIRAQMQRQTFHPLPWAKYPYRWRKADIDADIKRRRRW